MGAKQEFGAIQVDLAKAKRYIRSSGSGTVARSYFKETHSSIENAELDSKGLYGFERVIRFAFIEMMKEDAIFGRQRGFIEYVQGLSDSFEGPILCNWQPERSAAQAIDFMTSFYNVYSYQWKRQGRSMKRSLECFLLIMQECLDHSYLRLNDKFASLPKEIKDTINKAFFLANARIDEWHKAKLEELPAA